MLKLEYKSKRLIAIQVEVLAEQLRTGFKLENLIQTIYLKIRLLVAMVELRHLLSLYLDDE